MFITKVIIYNFWCCRVTMATHSRLVSQNAPLTLNAPQESLYVSTIPVRIHAKVFVELEQTVNLEE